MPALWRTDGFERSTSGNAVAAESVLGVPEVRPSLLDDLYHSTRHGSSSTCTTAQAYKSVIARVHAMNAKPASDDEDDEVFEDEEFDEDAELDEDDEDSDEDDGEEEETWQVARLDFVG
jgi:hypothetical protein